MLSSVRYCSSLDGVLAAHAADIGSTEQKQLFHQFLSLSLSSGKHQVSSRWFLFTWLSSDRSSFFLVFISLSCVGLCWQILGNSETSLLLSLKHPQPSVRVSAVEHLKDVVTSGEVDFLFESLLLFPSGAV